MRGERFCNRDTRYRRHRRQRHYDEAPKYVAKRLGVCLPRGGVNSPPDTYRRRVCATSRSSRWGACRDSPVPRSRSSIWVAPSSPESMARIAEASTTITTCLVLPGSFRQVNESEEPEFLREVVGVILLRWDTRCSDVTRQSDSQIETSRPRWPWTSELCEVHLERSADQFRHLSPLLSSLLHDKPPEIHSPASAEDRFMHRANAGSKESACLCGHPQSDICIFSCL